ncbi:MAG: dTMP kinase [Pirellulaceae bacterium]|nr:dTMP kinase [Pirellulaceae bacterium]MDP7020387.1 dTMP kinase [Pirellulaceae bacterium]
MFLSLDGVDGAGKSTQMDLLCQWLRDEGRDVVRCRDPGSTSLGEAVRRLLLDPDSQIDRRSEMLLYMAARAQMVEDVIRPHLKAGGTVVSDRYLLANVVYQAHAGGLDPAEVWDVGRVATRGLTPHLTIVLDLDIDTAKHRMDRELDRMEAAGDDFHRRVREGFLAEAKGDEAIAVVAASASIETVAAEIRRLVSPLLSAEETV